MSYSAVSKMVFLEFVSNKFEYLNLLFTISLVKLLNDRLGNKIDQPKINPKHINFFIFPPKKSCSNDIINSVSKIYTKNWKKQLTSIGKIW